MATMDPDDRPLTDDDLRVLSALDAELGPDPFLEAPAPEVARGRRALDGFLVAAGLLLVLISLQAPVAVGIVGCGLITVGVRRLVDQRRQDRRPSLP